MSRARSHTLLSGARTPNFSTTNGSPLVLGHSTMPATETDGGNSVYLPCTSGGWIHSSRLTPFGVAYPLRFCFVRVVCVPDDSSGQRVGHSSLRLSSLQPFTRPNNRSTFIFDHVLQNI